MFDFLRRLFGAAPAAAPKLKRIERDGTLSESVFVSHDPRRGVSLEQAAALRAEAMARIGDAGLPISQKMNAAARLMTGGAFKECVAAYEEIARQHPEAQGDCCGQIGAAYFFLGDYETAILYYEKALAHGADPSMMADNIEEAQEALGRAS